MNIKDIWSNNDIEAVKNKSKKPFSKETNPFNEYDNEYQMINILGKDFVERFETIAKDYLCAAKKLYNKQKTYTSTLPRGITPLGFGDTVPLVFLCKQCTELIIKAKLLMAGIPYKTIINSYGHNLNDLWCALKAAINFSSSDKIIIIFCDEYIKQILNIAKNDGDFRYPADDEKIKDKRKVNMWINVSSIIESTEIFYCLISKITTSNIKAKE